jgi:hypothetical protein
VPYTSTERAVYRTVRGAFSASEAR